MHQFDTRHAEFEGFSEFYDREVAPVLSERDSVRRKAVQTGLLWGFIGFIVLFGAGAFVHVTANLPDAITGLVMLAGLATPFIVFLVMTQSIRDETKDRIVSSIVGYVGWNFDSGVSHFGVHEFQTLFLIPKQVDDYDYEDKLFGQVHGAEFQSVEAHLEVEVRDSKGGTSRKTVFRGQLITLDFPTKTYGRTIVLRDRGWFNKKKQSDMKRIGLADPVFEKLFEAYGTDQVESRVILDPAFMQRIVDLETALSGKNIRFGFNNDRLFIAVETPNQYEAGSMFKSLKNPKRTQKILDEVGAIFDIVDLLLSRQ